MADLAPPHPEQPGLAVLVVGTPAAPFPPEPDVPDVPGATVVLVHSGTAHGVGDAHGHGVGDAHGHGVGDARRHGGTAPEGVRVLRIREDVGRGAAVNRAVAALPPEIGLVAVAPPGLTGFDAALPALHAAAARHPRAGILAPAVRAADGAAVPSTHPLPAPGRGVLAVLGRRPWPPPAGPDPVREEPVGWSSAPALLLRRAALDSVDGFDPRYPARLDDLDLAARLGVTGWLVVHVPTATVGCTAPPRPDPAADRRYLSDRTARPVGALLRALAP